MRGIQSQRTVGLIEAGEVREKLGERDTSLATLPFGSRTSGQQVRVLDATNEEFGEANSGIAAADGAATRPYRGNEISMNTRQNNYIELPISKS